MEAVHFLERDCLEPDGLLRYYYTYRYLAIHHKAQAKFLTIQLPREVDGVGRSSGQKPKVFGHDGKLAKLADDYLLSPLVPVVNLTITINIIHFLNDHADDGDDDDEEDDDDYYFYYVYVYVMLLLLMMMMMLTTMTMRMPMTTTTTTTTAAASTTTTTMMMMMRRTMTMFMTMMIMIMITIIFTRMILTDIKLSTFSLNIYIYKYTLHNVHMY